MVGPVDKLNDVYEKSEIKQQVNSSVDLFFLGGSTHSPHSATHYKFPLDHSEVHQTANEFLLRLREDLLGVEGGYNWGVELYPIELCLGDLYETRGEPLIYFKRLHEVKT